MFSSLHTHSPWLKFALSHHLHVHGHPCVCGLFTLILLFYFLLYLPHLFLFLNERKSVVNLHNSCNESVDATDDFLLSTVSGRPQPDCSAQAHSPSGCIYSGCSTQCGLQRCLNTTLAFRVLSTVRLFKRPTASHKSCSRTRGHQQHPQYHWCR